MTVKKDKSSEAGREFWEVAAQASETVKAWPAWKRGESTLGKLDPPVLTREQILAALKRAASGANELDRRLDEVFRLTPEQMTRRLY